MLCPECRAALDGAAPSRVRPVPEPTGLPVVHAAARYADSVRAVLLAHKERGALGLAGPLGTALAGAVWAAVREVCEPGGGFPALGGDVPEAGALGRGRDSSGAEVPALGGDVPEAEALGRGRDLPGAEVLARGGDVPGAEALSGGGDVPGAGVSAWGGDVPGAQALARGGDIRGVKVLARSQDVPGAQALARGGGARGVEALARSRDVPGAEGMAAGAVLGGAGSVGGRGLWAGAFVGGGWRGDGLGVPVLLVPVPSARRAVRARGHDPARRIALAAAGELRRAGIPARVVAVLRQRRRVADQSGLNSRQRQENLVGALTVVPGGGRLLAEGLVVLVDDLMTTGASLTEAARAVREARARENSGNRGEQMRTGHRDQRQRCRPPETDAWPGDCRPGAGAREGHRQPGTVGQRVQGRRGRDERHGQQRQDVSGRRGGRVVAGCDGEGTGAVYTAATRESMGERLVTVTEEDPDRERCSVTVAGVGGVRDVICAAVVAASPDSFEINRN